MALQTQTFSYGSLAYQSVSNGYILELTLTEQSTDLASNTSVIDYALRLRSGGNNRFSSYGLGATVTLDGKVVATRDRYNAAKVSLGYHSSVTLLSGTVDITHDPDGSKLMSVAFAIDMATGSYVPGPISVTGESMALTAIPRASTIGAANADIGSVCAISINRKNSAFTHTIGWKFGAISGYIGSDWQVTDTPVKLTDTSIAFSVPHSFYGQIPDDPSGVCVLTITTYSGDTQVGDPQSAEFTAKANDTVCAPEVTGTVEDVNPKTLALTGNDPKRLVRFFSTARCSMTVTAKNGASISEVRIGGTVVEDNDYQGAAQAAVSVDIPNVELTDIPFGAVDSRGFSGTDADENLVLIPYIRLTSNPSIKRTDPTSGNAQLRVDGNYFRGSFGAVENTLSVKYKVGSGDYMDAEVTIGENGGYMASATISGLEYTQAHDVEVIVEDALSTVPKTVTVGKGIPVFDWGQSDFRFNVPVSMPQLVLDGYPITAWGYWGVCGNANDAKLSGVYILDETSTNVPNQNGMLLAFRCGNADLSVPRPVWQVAMNYYGGDRKCRMLWYDNTPTDWVDL